MILLWALVLGAGLFVLIARPEIVSSTPHNLLLITVDRLRADRLGACGWARAATPSIDGLAARGVVFENAFTAAPITFPAHAALLTGRLPPHHGVRGNSFYALPGAQSTLSTLLKARGYRTAAVGFYQYLSGSPFTRTVNAQSALGRSLNQGNVVVLAGRRNEDHYRSVNLFDLRFNCDLPLATPFVSLALDVFNVLNINEVTNAQLLRVPSSAACGVRAAPRGALRCESPL